MTSRWGPLGWMTLHSISVCYPETPTVGDKLILERFIGNFAECITCPTCKGHFSRMFESYRQRYRDWADNRRNVFVMVCRLHNTVNKRLDKPRPASVKECLDMLADATKVTSQNAFRHNYIQYLIKNWAIDTSGEGFMMKGATRELQRINTEYWNLRETSYVGLEFEEANVLEEISEGTAHYKVGNGIVPFNPNIVSSGFRLLGGRLSLKRR